MGSKEKFMSVAYYKYMSIETHAVSHNKLNGILSDGCLLRFLRLFDILKRRVSTALSHAMLMKTSRPVQVGKNILSPPLQAP